MKKPKSITPKNIVLVSLALVKSFFLAITQVAWGLLSIFAFNAVLVYLNETRRTDIHSVSQTFLSLEAFIGNNIMFFVGVFFLLFAYFEIKEVLKK